MKRLWIGLTVVLLGLVVAWWWPRGEIVASQESVAAGEPSADRASVGATQSHPNDASGAVKRVAKKRRIDAKQRDAYLKRIAQGVEQHVAARGDRGQAPDTPVSPDDDSADAGAAEAGEVAEPSVADRSDGELSDLMNAVNSDLMPLIDECYQAAAERDPQLAGMIDINLEMAGDQDVGGIVESFELGEENEIRDEEMIECIRETTLSTVFPAPKNTGRRGARLTLMFAPSEPDPG